MIDSRTKQIQRSDALLARLQRLAIAEKKIAAEERLVDTIGKIVKSAESPHDHREYVEGCYRCDLSRTEVDACPKCGASGDDPCRKPNGRVADAAHKVRGATAQGDGGAK